MRVGITAAVLGMAISLAACSSGNDDHQRSTEHAAGTQELEVIDPKGSLSLGDAQGVTDGSMIVTVTALQQDPSIKSKLQQAYENGGSAAVVAPDGAENAGKYLSDSLGLESKISQAQQIAVASRAPTGKMSTYGADEGMDTNAALAWMDSQSKLPASLGDSESTDWTPDNVDSTNRQFFGKTRLRDYGMQTKIVNKTGYSCKSKTYFTFVNVDWYFDEFPHLEYRGIVQDKAILLPNKFRNFDGVSIWEMTPPSTENTTTVTSGYEKTLTGHVSIDKGGPKADVTQTLRWYNETSTTTPPLDINLKTNLKDAQAKWLYSPVETKKSLQLRNTSFYWEHEQPMEGDIGLRMEYSFPSYKEDSSPLGNFNVSIPWETPAKDACP